MSLLISPLYAALLALILMSLGVRAALLRHRLKIGYGDRENKVLRRALRAHANAAENIPGCMVLLILFEAVGGPSVWIHAAGGVLVFARVLHGFGLSKSTGASPGRFFGIALTQLTAVVLAVSVAVLAAQRIGLFSAS